MGNGRSSGDQTPREIRTNPCAAHRPELESRSALARRAPTAIMVQAPAADPGRRDLSGHAQRLHQSAMKVENDPADSNPTIRCARVARRKGCEAKQRLLASGNERAHPRLDCELEKGPAAKLPLVPAPYGGLRASCICGQHLTFLATPTVHLRRENGGAHASTAGPRIVIVGITEDTAGAISLSAADASSIPERFC